MELNTSISLQFQANNLSKRFNNQMWKILTQILQWLLAISFGIVKIKQREEQNPEKKSQCYSYQVLKIGTEPLSIWAMGSSWNTRDTTFKFIIGEMANGRLMFWSANWFSWIRSCTFCLCKNWQGSTSDFLVLLNFLSVLIPCFCYCESYTGISHWSWVLQARWCYVMGYTVSRSLHWNQDSWLVLGGRTAVQYVCDPVLLLLPLWSIAKHPLLKQKFMEIFSSWEVLLFILLVLGNGCLRCMEGLGLSQHFTIQHDSPDVVVVFAKIFLPSAANRSSPRSGFGFSPCCLPQRWRSCTPQVSVAEGKALWPVKVVQQWGIPRVSLAEQKRVRGGLQAAASVAPCAWEILGFRHCSRNISGFYLFTVKFLFHLLSTLLCSFQILNLFSWTYSWVISSIS